MYSAYDLFILEIVNSRFGGLKMAFMDWTDDLSVGIKEIDSQHQRLIQIINTLYDAMKAGKGQEVLGKTLDELVNYTVYHFQVEENYFQKFNYPEKDAHKIQHQKFVEKIEQSHTEFQNGSISVATSLLPFLSKWLFSHIRGTDKKYTNFFHEHGLS